jgi:hypothetical protein
VQLLGDVEGDLGHLAVLVAGEAGGGGQARGLGAGPVFHGQFDGHIADKPEVYFLAFAVAHGG